MKKGLQKLTPIIIVVLGFFTLGISDLIWIYDVSDKFDYKRFLPMKQVALTAITFGVYGIFWVYRMSSQMYKTEYIKSKTKVLLCTILSIFFLRNISVSILYRAFNDKETDVLVG